MFKFKILSLSLIFFLNISFSHASEYLQTIAQRLESLKTSTPQLSTAAKTGLVAVTGIAGSVALWKMLKKDKPKKPVADINKILAELKALGLLKRPVSVSNETANASIMGQTGAQITNCGDMSGLIESAKVVQALKREQISKKPKIPLSTNERNEIVVAGAKNGIDSFVWEYFLKTILDKHLISIAENDLINVQHSGVKKELARVYVMQKFGYDPEIVAAQMIFYCGK